MQKYLYLLINYDYIRANVQHRDRSIAHIIGKESNRKTDLSLPDTSNNTSRHYLRGLHIALPHHKCQYGCTNCSKDTWMNQYNYNFQTTGKGQSIINTTWVAKWRKLCFLQFNESRFQPKKDQNLMPRGRCFDIQNREEKPINISVKINS